MISQRTPSNTPLHMLPVRPTIEFVITPVPPASTELVTLEVVAPFEVIELETLEELLDSIELADPPDEMVWAEAHAQHSPKATATRYFMSVPP